MEGSTPSGTYWKPSAAVSRSSITTTMAGSTFWFWVVLASAPLFPYKNPRIVVRNLGGGRFEELFDEAGPAIAIPHSSRGCAFGDFDNDGDIDIVIMNMNEPPSLLRNDTSGKHNWIKVQ